MKFSSYILIAITGLLLISCTEGVEREAARIRFNVNPSYDNESLAYPQESDYRKLAEMVYDDSVMLYALKEVGVEINAQTSKIYRDSILVTLSPGYYDKSTHDLVVWQNDGERAFRLVNALYDRLVDYYTIEKSKPSEVVAVADNDEAKATAVQTLTNDLEKLERRMERWASNTDSMRALEEEKATLLAQFEQQVSNNAGTPTTTGDFSESTSPYTIYTQAEHLGITRMPKRK